MNVALADHQDITLLLVEDDEIDVMAIQRAFKKHRIANPLVHASDGEEALTMLRDTRAVPRPYVILMDLNMPNLSGLEMLEQLRQDPSLAPSVVFVITTSKAEHDKAAAYNKNVAGYITKKDAGDNYNHLISMLNGYLRCVSLP